MGQRLVTFIVDSAIIVALTLVVASMRAEEAVGAGVNSVRLTGWTILLVYYILAEAATGRTVGKLLAGTKVVNEVNRLPTFGQIVGRSLARLVPFEPLSFIFSTRG